MQAVLPVGLFISHYKPTDVYTIVYTTNQLMSTIVSTLQTNFCLH